MGKYYFYQLFWALEAGYLNLSGGVPQSIDGSDIHQAFHPCHKDVGVPKPTYKTKIEHTSDKITPNFDVSYTEEMTPGKKEFPNGDGMDFRGDPFLMLCAFPHKETSGTWGGGAATYGTIIGNFSAFDDISSIMMQYGMTDGSTPISNCLNGVKITEYILGYKNNSIMKEKVKLEVPYVKANTQAFIPNSNFDDGKWSLWSLKNTIPKIYPGTIPRVYWDDAHLAEFVGLEIQECEMKMVLPSDLEKIAKNIYYSEQWMKEISFEATIKGILTGNTEYLELEKLFKDKTQKDLRMTWDETANKVKYLQFENAIIEALDDYIIPSRANARKITMTLFGDNCSTSQSFENLPDPTSRIDLSP